MENNVQTVDDRIKKVSTKEGLKVTRIFKSDWQKKGTMSAEIKQTIKTVSSYPSTSVSNDMQANIFDIKDYGFAEQTFESTETRVAWLDVPEAIKTPEEVVAKLAAFPEATIYKVLSNRPILTNDQKYAIAPTNGTPPLTTEAVIAARQAVRYPQTEEKVELRGKLILDPNGKIQYRVNFFANAAAPDLDRRTADPADYFASEEMEAELQEAKQRVF